MFFLEIMSYDNDRPLSIIDNGHRYLFGRVHLTNRINRSAVQYLNFNTKRAGQPNKNVYFRLVWATGFYNCLENQV